MTEKIVLGSLTKRFGPLVAVDAIDLTVRAGEVLGFLGPNGAGKSTCMKMVAGFLTPTGGSAVVCGHDVTREPVAVKRRLGYLPEGAPLYGDMTPASFLDFTAAVRGYDGAERRRRVGEVIEKVALGEVMGQTIDTLSKGFKRRVGLAQAMLHDPEVLILDEPTDGLDPNQKHQVRGLIRDMAKNKAIVISTHILEEVEAVCTRSVIIANGRLRADGTPAELLARAPGHNAVVLQVDAGAAEAIGKDLAALDDVAKVETATVGGGRTRLRVLPRNGRSIVVPVGETVRARGVHVHEMFTEKGALDDVFREITTGAGGAGGAHA